MKKIQEEILVQLPKSSRDDDTTFEKLYWLLRAATMLFPNAHQRVIGLL